MTSIPSSNVTPRTFWQLIVTIETTPAFLRGFEQFEDDGQRRPVGQASLRLDRAVAHGSEGAFNGIGRPQVFPVLGRGSRRTPVACPDPYSGSRPPSHI